MVATNAYIKLVPASKKENVTTDEIIELFHYYRDITSKTGKQLDWQYEASAFPYEIKEETTGKGTWFYLYSNQDRYHAILLGVDQETILDSDGNESKQTYIQVTLPESATFGDKGKANEFCKFLAKKLQAELHLFNGRVMYYYPRK